MFHGTIVHEKYLTKMDERYPVVGRRGNYCVMGAPSGQCPKRAAKVSQD